MARIRQISAKLGNMRKAADWVVYPNASPSPNAGGVDGALVIQIQSDHRIAQFNSVTGRGWLSKHKSNGAYGPDLLPILGATPVVVPADVIAAALDAKPKSGDEIGPGVYIA